MIVGNRYVWFICSTVTACTFTCVCVSSSSKDQEILGLQQKIEDDANEVATLQRRIRELEAKIEELEEDLQNEKRLRTRVCD